MSATFRRSLLPLVVIAAAAALGGCVAYPAPGYYGGGYGYGAGYGYGGYSYPYAYAPAPTVGFNFGWWGHDHDHWRGWR